MKKILSLIILLASSQCLPTGKLNLSGGYFTEHDKMLPQAGISVWEPVASGLFYDGYSGFGVSPRHALPNVYWVVSRHDFGMEFKPFTVSAGVTLRLSDQEFIGSENESNLHVKFVTTLW